MTTKAQATALVEALDIAAAYDGALQVLKGVSLLVPRGKLTVLAGSNGSGKSTLLSILSRVLKPAGGTVLLDGQEMMRLPTREIAKKLGLLPQGPIVPVGMTVYDLVSRGRYPHQGFLRQWTDADEEAVARALTATRLGDLANRAVDRLSGGQRQRAFIAMTLAQETAAILFDEPTTFLDLRYQVDVMELIASLSRDHGRTVVAVLHDLNAALQYADRLVFLKDGQIHSVVEDPHACSADLIGAVFDTEVSRLVHPQTGRPAFLPSRASRGTPP